MKKIILALALSFFSLATFSQTKYAYVDTKYILENIPEYIQAQKTLDDLSEKWQADIEAKKLLSIKNTNNTKLKSYYSQLK